MRIKFEYKNHRGLIEERDVDVVAVNFDFTVHPEYGYQPGWCFAGWDYSRGREGKEYRTFYFPNVILHDHTRQGGYRPVFTLFKLPIQAQLDFDSGLVQKAAPVSFAEHLQQVVEVQNAKQPDKVPCPVCHGSRIEQVLGRDNNVLEEPCSACDGTGEVNAA